MTYLANLKACLFSIPCLYVRARESGKNCRAEFMTFAVSMIRENKACVSYHLPLIWRDYERKLSGI